MQRPARCAFRRAASARTTPPPRLLLLLAALSCAPRPSLALPCPPMGDGFAVPEYVRGRGTLEAGGNGMAVTITADAFISVVGSTPHLLNGMCPDDAVTHPNGVVELRGSFRGYVGGAAEYAWCVLLRPRPGVMDVLVNASSNWPGSGAAGARCNHLSWTPSVVLAWTQDTNAAAECPPGTGADGTVPREWQGVAQQGESPSVTQMALRGQGLQLCTTLGTVCSFECAAGAAVLPQANAWDPVSGGVVNASVLELRLGTSAAAPARCSWWRVLPSEGVGGQAGGLSVARVSGTSGVVSGGEDCPPALPSPPSVGDEVFGGWVPVIAVTPSISPSVGATPAPSYSARPRQPAFRPACVAGADLIPAELVGAGRMTLVGVGGFGSSRAGDGPRPVGVAIGSGGEGGSFVRITTLLGGLPSQAATLCITE